MSDAFDPGALLGSSFALGDGFRVRLRLAHASDSALIRAPLARRPVPAEALELSRLVHFDPRRRVVICATALIDAAETVVGVGAIDLDGAGEPEIVTTDTKHADALSDLLAAALLSRADAAARARAA